MSWMKKGGLHKPLTPQTAVSADVVKNLDGNVNDIINLEDHVSKLNKEGKKYRDGIFDLSQAELKLTRDLSSSSLCNTSANFRALVEDYHTLSSQMENPTADMMLITQHCVLDSTKKFNGIFNGVNNCFRKQDHNIQECDKFQIKLKKYEAKEKTGPNTVKFENYKRALSSSTTDVKTQADLLLKELPKIHQSRIDYFSPCLEGIIKGQVDYYGEYTKLFGALQYGTSSKSDEEFRSEMERRFSAIESLSIVT